MSGRKTTLVGLALLGLVWTHTHTARACFCLPPRSVTEEFDASGAVFLGEVVNYAPGKIYFRVLQSWKGARATEICVENLSGVDCFLPVSIGERLVVYALKAPPTLLVWECTRTGMLNGALEDVETLTELGYEPLELDGPGPGDFNGDTFLDLTDFAETAGCLTGPCDSESCDLVPDAVPCCAIADSDDDGDVDLKDLAAFQLAFTGG